MASLGQNDACQRSHPGNLSQKTSLHMKKSLHYQPYHATTDALVKDIRSDGLSTSGVPLPWQGSVRQTWLACRAVAPI